LQGKGESLKAMRLMIDGQILEAREGMTLLEAAREAGIYIPAICAHPDLPPGTGMPGVHTIYRGPEQKFTSSQVDKFSGCRLCVIAVNEELKLACDTAVAEGMSVRTEGPEIQVQRQQALKEILKDHPHICLICPQREGCDRLTCSMNVPVEERCCWKFSDCELRKVSEYIGIPEDTPRYVPQKLPVLADEPLFMRDYNLCIGCTRCVRVCQDIRKALGFVIHDGKIIVGSVGPTLIASNCKFCTACVVLCPTGSLRDKDFVKAAERRRKLKIEYTQAPLPPEPQLVLNAETVARAPEREGVYQLLDERKNIIRIAGTPNLKKALEEQLSTNQKARFFIFEETPMYTQRESELLQEFLQKHGRLPEGNDELSELF